MSRRRKAKDAKKARKPKTLEEQANSFAKLRDEAILKEIEKLKSGKISQVDIKKGRVTTQ